MSFTLTMFLCGIILLQNFQFAAKFKKSNSRINSKIEETSSFLSFLTCESEYEESVVFWIKNNLKICVSNSCNGQSENEEEESKLIETDELCNTQYQLQIILADKNIGVNDVLSAKLPNPFLLRTSPPPEA